MTGPGRAPASLQRTATGDEKAIDVGIVPAQSCAFEELGRLQHRQRVSRGLDPCLHDDVPTRPQAGLQAGNDAAVAGSGVARRAEQGLARFELPHGLLEEVGA